ncbi:MAG TPA: hypothetical protein VGB77_10575 [Abditibacteriaceae bacterium]|jgi:hypothetical protein
MDENDVKSAANQGSEQALPEAPEDAPNVEVGPLEEYKTLGPMDVEVEMLRRFAGYAGPLRWGPWVEVARHGGVVNYNISYSAVGDTLVHGTVSYYSSSGWKSQVFRDSISITTGNAWATVKVCFHGNPLGSAVNGTINP